ncbi:hypothetical protein FACS189440_21720 [Bacteroidia bacterium]|nr:hypothetical protein FACS189423_09830 [Bacteroidia bacterium]GHT52115.1 hypothetical protein FACS189440_21720 [Bacteroidia bacterium]
MKQLWQKIKHYLRNNPFYIKHFQIPINNGRYFVRDCSYYFKKYTLKKDKSVQGNTLYFIIDPDRSHPGLVDRFKAIVGCYYIAQQSGFDFKLIFDHPFKLRTYLQPNVCDWYAEPDSLSYSLQNSKILSYNGFEIPKLNKKYRQYHVYNYIGYDILRSNKLPDFNALWGTLYRELFFPEKRVIQAIESLGIVENSYIAIHLRFINALGMIEEGHFNLLSSEEDKEALILRCIAGIKKIIADYPDKKVLIFSDSSLFLERIKQSKLPVIILDGEPGHISYVKNNPDDVVMKTFIDFYMMSRASKIIAIRAPEMFSSNFSDYAALVGNKFFEVLNI